jgi:2',3'-cyclic-nucleotide 2'-phosphodiesterase (5'-nucleotidase family)
MQITLVHTNDIHGRTTALARAATLINEIRANTEHVVYLDAGDLEDTTNRLSNLTKGVQILQLLNVMECAAFTPGNAAYIRYGPGILTQQAAVTHFPMLLANFEYRDGRPFPGLQPCTIIEIGGAKLGVIGVTCPLWYEKYFPVRALPTVETVKTCAAQLREQGAHGVIVLSHLGYEIPHEPGYIGDKALAAQVQGEVQAIIGGHSHTLLPEGEWVGDVLIAQARHYGEYFGRIDLEFDGERITAVQARAIPIPEDTPVWQPVLDLEQALLDQTLRELDACTIGELSTPITFAADRLCGAGHLAADALRERAGVAFACTCAGNTIVKDLPAGRLSRLALWEACWSPAAIGVAELTGTQLTELVRRGLNRDYAAVSHSYTRGLQRGLLHLSGGTWQNDQLLIGGQAVESDARYRIAATDYEFEPWPERSYSDVEWGLQPVYDTTIMLREVLEDYITRHSPVAIADRESYNSTQN